jgi:soluble lytic murein transglycosylase-like protein
MKRFRVFTIGLVATATLWAAAPAVAEVYKYRDADGLILLTDKPMRGMYLIKRYQLSTGRTDAAEGESALSAMYRRRDALEPLIDDAAQDTRLETALVHAVIRAESAYRSDAVSVKGAVGLMQLMPATAERYGVSDRRDPAQNLRGGTRYLRDLLDMFDNDLRLALAAYNAGENAVLRHGRRIPPYRETEEYVRRVLGFFEQMGGDRLALR